MADDAVDGAVRHLEVDPAQGLDGAPGARVAAEQAAATLTVDLGSSQNVSSFIVKHAGLGGEQTNWNTGAFTISTSTDNVTFSQAVAVTGSRASRTYSPVAPRGRR